MAGRRMLDGSGSRRGTLDPAEDPSGAVQKYGAFVEEVLRPQLQASLRQRDALATEIGEYEELQRFVLDELVPRQQQLQKQPNDEGNNARTLAVLMDLGQRFQVRAKIDDPTLITIDIGLNFHVEMTPDEAARFVEGHLAHLHEKRRTWQDKARQISEHVNMVLEAIQQLAGLQAQQQPQPPRR